MKDGITNTMQTSTQPAQIQAFRSTWYSNRRDMSHTGQTAENPYLVNMLRYSGSTEETRAGCATVRRSAEDATAQLTPIILERLQRRLGLRRDVLGAGALLSQ
jgi:hypothetical protein